MITAEGRKQEGTKEMSLFNPLSLSLSLCLIMDETGWKKKNIFRRFLQE